MGEHWGIFKIAVCFFQFGLRFFWSLAPGFYSSVEEEEACKRAGEGLSTRYVMIRPGGMALK